MTRRYINDAIAAMLEDIFRFKLDVPYRDELEAFFEPEQFEEFTDMVRNEFDLGDNTIVESATTFAELIILIEDEITP